MLGIMAKVPDFKATPKPFGGRPLGVQNKIPAELRARLKEIVDGQIENVPLWFATVATGIPELGLKPDPKGCIMLLGMLSEYVLPKLTRVEHVGNEGAALQVEQIVRVIVDSKADVAAASAMQAAAAENDR